MIVKWRSLAGSLSQLPDRRLADEILIASTSHLTCFNQSFDRENIPLGAGLLLELKPVYLPMSTRPSYDMVKGITVQSGR